MAAHRLFACGLALAGLSGTTPAPAEPEVKAPRAETRRAAVGCRVQGVTRPRANAAIEDVRGRLLARFSGAPTRLVVEAFPAGRGGRVRIATGTGRGSFRVNGFTRVRDLPLYSTEPIAVSSGHVWIAPGRSLAFIASGRGALRVEKRVGAPFDQSFRAWAPCASLALAPPEPPAAPRAVAAPVTELTSYAARRPRLELLGEPRRSSARVATLTPAPDAPPPLFIGREQRGEWVRVEHRGEVIIDAWARAADLEPLARVAAFAPLGGGVAPAAAPLAVQGEPRVVRTLREVPFRAAALETEPAIGVIEPDAEVYVLDLVSGWASVMPKALEVVPRPDGQFWARAEELGM